jgi:hypothetical protein
MIYCRQCFSRKEGDLQEDDSSFRLSSAERRKQSKLKATRIIVLLHQFNCGIYIADASRCEQKFHDASRFPISWEPKGFSSPSL